MTAANASDVSNKGPSAQIVLPGSWWTIPVTDEDASKRAIHALANKVTNKMDDFARLRADLRRQLTELTDTAREGGAGELYLALEIVPGMPIPMSIAVFWPDLNVLGSTPSDSSTVIELVRIALQSASDAGEYTDEEVATLGASATFRRCKTITHEADGDVPEYSTLVVDYWVAVPGTQHVALLSFSTNFPHERELMIELFKTIVESLRWAPAPE